MDCIVNFCQQDFSHFRVWLLVSICCVVLLLVVH